MSRPPFGQNFLADASWRAKIIRAISPAKGDVWIEIGAGHGEMTEHLARTAARVVAIELDEKLLPSLGAFADKYPFVVQVVPGNILEIQLEPFLGRRISPASHDAGPAGEGRAAPRVYGNLPYYITSPILHRLFEHADRIRGIHVVTQLEVALRLVARPATKDYGYLSVATQFYTKPEIALRIPPAAFRPQPKVSSALVTLRLPGERAQLKIPEEKAFLEFVKTCFAQKRKTLFNNLRASSAKAKPLDEVEARALLQSAGLRPDARAEQLSVAQFCEIFRLRSAL